MKSMLYGGYSYYKSDNGYFKRISKGTSRYLHRVIYEDEYGEIPEGCQVHHKDHDRLNNDLSNLVALKSKDHQLHHQNAMTLEQKEARRINLLVNAIPKAVEWHGSDEGKAWHMEHYENTKDALRKKHTRKCAQCGNDTESHLKNINAFCSNKCKASFRRHSGVDDIARVCEMCETEYKVNKYAKSRTCSRSCANRIRARDRSEGRGQG